MSLSARRAWIEIISYCKEYTLSIVALRKESVDRNGSSLSMSCSAEKSLSARRAWIEIEVENGFAGVLFVALRKESVDRNKMPVPA